MSSANIFVEGATGAIEECVGRDGFELSCAYPMLGRLYLPFERFHDPTETLRWMRSRPAFPIVACALYLVLVAVGRSRMANQPAWSWRRTLAAWNLSLSLFSTIGFLRTAPHLIHDLATHPLRDVMCGDLGGGDDYLSNSTGLWVQLFVLSKFPELFDTFFIVIHKKPLIFLHWYHHVTVLLYCWYSYVTASPTGLFFVVMNYCVHAVMYGYYFLMAVKMRPKWFNPAVVTFMQLGQMFVGVAVTVAAFHYHNNPVEGRTCNIRKENNVAAFVMYGSYFYLFLQFFLTRYVRIKVGGSMQKKKKLH